MKKLTILCDNNTFIDQYLLGEPALSFLIETDEKKVLFDFGYSDVTFKNAEILGFDINQIDYAVLSHGHNDHTGGIQFWNGKRIPLICHPDCIGKTVYEQLDIGCPLSESELNEKFELSFTKQPYWITENLCFLGEIPTSYTFEKRISIGKKLRDEWEVDLVLEDSALVLKTKTGLWILTGCSHSGICSIIQHAIKVCGCDKIAGVIGGFHLLEKNEKLIKTIETLKNFEINRLIPTHCVNLASKIEMSKYLKIEEAGAGLTIVLEE
ncbi:MAG: MBL fold metallo-hydrolase [Erysipelotrichaceae bacterium]|nr:MBL fold metallo-hydrolase [Erysipelotrichaceae bacterium]